MSRNNDFFSVSSISHWVAFGVTNGYLSEGSDGSRLPIAVSGPSPTMPGYQTPLQFLLLSDAVQWMVVFGGEAAQLSELSLFGQF